ncbi:MAG: plastocyanin/azurin family copper-binding protein, partial [Chloroflexota bacterium]
ALIIAIPGPGAVRSLDAHASAPAAHHTKTIAISGFAFHSASVTVKRGTVVMWTNKDSAIHTVSFNWSKLRKYDSGNLGHNKTFRHRFNSVGSFRYHCSYHAFMKGVIHVKH